MKKSEEQRLIDEVRAVLEPEDRDELHGMVVYYWLTIDEPEEIQDSLFPEDFVKWLSDMHVVYGDLRVFERVSRESLLESLDWVLMFNTLDDWLADYAL